MGARPLGLVDCLNFGNPEHPEVMWQLSEAIDGMAEACRAYGVPVVGGNVSLYNEANGVNIDPSPVVGALGVVDSLERRPPSIALPDDATLLVVGAPATTLSGSAWAWRQGHKAGTPPQVDHKAHLDAVDLVRSIVVDGLALAVHDLAGGFGPALGEMCAAGGVGATVELPGAGDTIALFGETPSAVIVAVADDDLADVRARAEGAGVPTQVVGRSGGDRLVIGSAVSLRVSTVVDRWANALPDALGAGNTQG